MRKELSTILNLFAHKVREQYPKARVWAFGSHTRGTATAESDFDICVVLPDMVPNDRLVISDLAWEIGFENDVHLSTIVLSEKDFEHGPLSASPLVGTIRNEGIPA